MAFRVKDWDKFFETHESRKLKRLSWVPVPNKHDGLGFRTLMGGQNGYEVYAAWVLVLQVASKCPIRGTLVDDSGRGLTAEDLAIKTGAPVKAYERALPILLKIGWIEELTETPADDAGTPARHAGTPADSPVGREGKGREQKGTEITACSESENPDSKPPEPAILVFPCQGKRPEWHLTRRQIDKWRSLYPGLDVLAESRKALAWIEANPMKRKTFVGMPGFLVRWFSRATDSPCARQDAAFGHRRRDASSFADVGPDGEVPV